MINKKGQINFNLDAGGVALIILIVLILLLIGGFAVFLNTSNNEYENQTKTGQNLLNNLMLSVQYIEPEEGSTIGILIPSINGTNADNKISARVKYYATKFDYSKSESIDQYDLILPNNFPTNLSQKKIDTAYYLSNLGSQAKICVSIEFTYEGLNWIRFINGYGDKKYLNDCKPLSIIFGKNH